MDGSASIWRHAHRTPPQFSDIDTHESAHDIAHKETESGHSKTQSSHFQKMLLKGKSLATEM